MKKPWSFPPGSESGQLDLLRGPWPGGPVDSVGPYRPDPPSVPVETSEEAADSVAHVTGELRRRVYDFLVARGIWGATDEEIGTSLKLALNTVRPRRRELVLIERVWQSDKRRETSSGRSAIVWTAIRPAHVPAPDAEYDVCPKCRGSGRIRCG